MTEIVVARVPCGVRGCVDRAVSTVVVEHPQRDPFRVNLCGVHLTITSAVATITISPLTATKTHPSNLSDDRLADLIDQVAASQVHDHRADLLSEAARRLRSA